MSFALKSGFALVQRLNEPGLLLEDRESSGGSELASVTDRGVGEATAHWQHRVEGASAVEEFAADWEPDDSVLSWQERALCAQTDPEAFFPEKGGSTREAKKVCLSCDVRSECLEYALSKDERFGIWGGLSERERRKLKKRAV